MTFSFTIQRLGSKRLSIFHFYFTIGWLYYLIFYHCNQIPERMMQRGKMCFGSWFQRALSVVAEPHELGQNIPAVGICDRRASLALGGQVAEIKIGSEGACIPFKIKPPLGPPARSYLIKFSEIPKQLGPIIQCMSLWKTFYIQIIRSCT
jgi:hypothetical protein